MGPEVVLSEGAKGHGRAMHRVTKVRVLEGYRLRLTFDDGTCGTADLSHLAGKGVFSVWADRRVFRGVRIGDAGELVWSDQVDLCPDALYLQATGKQPEDVFPALKTERAHA